MINAIKTRKGFLGTIEFFPEEGKYHYDGHRLCNVSFAPKETIKNKYLCPVCGKRVTVGVMHRVELLSDREEGIRPDGAPGYHSIIPLNEIIAEILNVGVNAQAVQNLYMQLLSRLGNEFRILMDTPLEEIEKAGSELLMRAIERMRAGKVSIKPGYDGEYGKIRIFDKPESMEIKGQASLF
jgi:PHP family Zn ribbon phosphoesterase